MDLKEIIEELINSNVIQNEELALTLLQNPSISDEIKRKHLDNFMSEFNSDRGRLLDEDRKEVLQAWIELYNIFMKDDIKNRVKRII